MCLLFIFSFILNNYLAPCTAFLSFKEIVGGLNYEKYPYIRVKLFNQLNIYSKYPQEITCHSYYKSFVGLLRKNKFFQEKYF